MAGYKVEVKTGDMKYAGTWDHIFITLFGTKGQSQRTELKSYGLDFKRGKTGTYTIKTSMSLGKILLVKVEKDPFFPLPKDDEWYFSNVVVTTPEGDAMLFPCYRWISRGELVELRGGRAMKVYEDVHPLLIEHRSRELAQKKGFYRWKTLAEGLSHIIGFNHPSELPTEFRLSRVRISEGTISAIKCVIELKIKGMVDSSDKWENLEDIKGIFWFQKTTMSEYVTEHWMEDDFYGYQFLNGINPTVIKLCSKLPPNFPVTEEMVKPFLEEGTSLQKEIEKGNILIYDQKKMDGIQPRVYNGERLHVTPGLCLFYMNPKNKLMPIAIQLHQQPSEENPIFLPSDLQTDWLLAKMFLKNADSLVHESVYHLMNTHFLAEVFAVSTHRCLPEIHPLYKLLLPHFRYTLPINTDGRKTLFGRNQGFNASSLGYDGIIELMRRYLADMTYSSLCLPEDIAERGLESIPNYYYRDDGLKLWDMINRFVKGIVEHYYTSDSEVCKDTELQEWISEIFTHGFLGNQASGFPSSFGTVEEVIKFITMIIFTVTAQHSAVNNGQFDFYTWIPNASLLLHKAPPTTKGQSSMTTILETLPTIGETVSYVTLGRLLSEKYSDLVLLGSFTEDRFNEPYIRQLMQEFQADLSYLGEAITARNAQLEVPYTYLHPSFVENSVAI